MKQGLADAVGDMHSVIAAEFGDVRFVDRVGCVGARFTTRFLTRAVLSCMDGGLHRM